MPTTSDSAAIRRQRRADPREAEAVLARVLPSAGLRRQVLGPLAESVLEAHRSNPAAWEVTLDLARPLVRLNMGRVYAFSLEPGDLILTVVADAVDRAARREMRAAGVRAQNFKVLPSVQFLRMTPEALVALWPSLRQAHFSALAEAGTGLTVSPYARAHSPGVLAHLGEVVGRSLPQPEYPKVGGLQPHVEELIRLVRRHYPDWSGFDHPAFVRDEREYKLRAIRQVGDLLASSALAQLLARGDHDEFIRRLDVIGKDPENNLLFRRVPMSGDLGILYRTDLDKPAFCGRVFDLLHGPGETPERLDRYVAYVAGAGLPNKWTFPTYFLWACDPVHEVFVKPSAASRVLRLLGLDATLGASPSGAAYAEFREAVLELKEPLAAFGPRDATDLQGFLWVAIHSEDTIVLTKRSEMEGLLWEFRRAYPATDAGSRHLASYSAVRRVGQENYEAARRAEAAGEDVTDMVLTRLLPHIDSEGNRGRGAWIHWAPSVTKDVKQWFENAGWVQAGDWPAVARGLLGFIGRASGDPDDVDGAWREFESTVPAKGFQTGMLTPILNALQPESLLIVNAKSLRVFNYFAETDFRQSFEDYPEANRTGLAIAGEMAEPLSGPELGDLAPADVLDMFAHWLVAVKRFDFGKRGYWKIAPGENAHFWEACREGGFIAIGWGELGDLSNLDRTGFKARRDEVLQTHPGWTKGGLDQVWKFTQIQEGDVIVANRGTQEVVGVGTVTGPYYYDAGEKEHPHRIPVSWDDCLPRAVNEAGWRKTLVQLEKQKVEEILKGSPPPPPPSGAFSVEGFEFLKRLRATPTREFYLQEKEHLVALVEEPLQRLMRAVATQLRPPMPDALETGTNVFARVLKNDWGRGGAWDFYWGAFYPRGGRRIEDAQLYVSASCDGLDYGFSIGRAGERQEQRFLEHWRRERGLFEAVVEELPGDLQFGRRAAAAGSEGPGPTAKEWLADPAATGIQVHRELTREAVLGLTFEALRDRIAADFERLFPLFLFASQDDARAAVQEFLGISEPLPPNPRYSLEQWADETGFDTVELGRWVQAIRRKGQVILYGPPGTGKTYMALRFARHLLSEGDGIREVVQFHPSYSYEDFVQGIRPRRTPGGELTYEMEPGRFLQFCQRARRSQGTCVLIVDEINRANLSRVLGELMYLLEYRDDEEREIPLAGGGAFRVPKNVQVIGTMNTADRSIALVDHALRRRFAFLELRPNFDVLRRFHESHGTGFPVEPLIEVLQRVNQAIHNAHYELGISFFLRKDLAREIEDVWRMEIEPYLEEYFFDQEGKVGEHRWAKVGPKLGL